MFTSTAGTAGDGWFPFSCISSLSWLPLEEPRNTRSTRKGRTRKPCLWRFRLFESFESFVVTLGRTTKYTKYTKGKNKEVPVFDGFAFPCISSLSWLPLEKPH